MICRLTELFYLPASGLNLPLIYTKQEDSYLQDRLAGTVVGWLVTSYTHSRSHLGAARNDRTLVLLADERFN